MLFGTIITLGETFTTDLLAYVGYLYTDLSPLILLAIGLPIGFWAVRKVISLVKAR
jgi:hypothetical protein